MNPTLITLLQLSATLLGILEHHPNMPLAMQARALAMASQAIELSTQALATPGFLQTQSPSIWPNFDRLRSSLYLDTHGARIPLGETVYLVSEDISFGDVNNDGRDDAVVIVKRPQGPQDSSYALATMLNQGGILFNIGDVPLGKELTVYDHRILSGKFIIDMQVGNGPRKIFHYQLLGNQLIPL